MTQKIENRYQARIIKQDGSYYAFVVYVGADKTESVDGAYRARFFTTEKAAIKSTSAYIAKLI